MSWETPDGVNLDADTPQGLLSERLIVQGGKSFKANEEPGVTTFSMTDYVPVSTINWTGTNGLVVGDQFTGSLTLNTGQSLWASDSTHKANATLTGTHGSYSGDQLFFTKGTAVTQEGALAADLSGAIKTSASGPDTLQGLHHWLLRRSGDKQGGYPER